MPIKSLFLLGCALLLAGQFQGQCPPGDALRKRIICLRDSLKPPLRVQLIELLGFVDKMTNCPYKNDSTHVFLLGRIGDIYFKQSDYFKAVEYRRMAIDIMTANFSKPSVKPKTLPGRYYYLSVAYDSLNNFTEKMKALDSSFTIALRIKYMDRASLTALYTRVEYYFDIGDYRQCIDYATKCELLGREYASKNTGVEQIAGEKFASSSLGWHVNALLKLEKFETADEFLRNKIEEYKKAGLTNYLGLVYGQLALVQENRGNYDKSLIYFNQSFKCYQDSNDLFNCKQVLKDIGYHIYFKHFGDNDKALFYYRKALKYVNDVKTNNTEDIFETLNIYSNIGMVYVEKGLYDSAFKYFQLAFDQIKPGSSEQDILRSTPERLMQFKRNYYLSDLVINKGYAFQKQYEKIKVKSSIEKAIEVYKVADQLLDRIKVEQTDLESKLFWRSDSRRLYENAIDACYMLGSASDAFYFFERSRAVLLNDQLNEKRFLGEQDIMRLTQIKKKIHQLQKEIEQTDKSADRVTELQDDIFNHKQELDRLLGIIKNKNPLFYQNFLDSNGITIKDVRQRILDVREALVELFNGKKAVYVFIITRENIDFRKREKESFENLSDSFNYFIADKDLLNRNFDAFIRVSQQLYQLIFGDITLPAGRIVISPDGQYFPIEALVTSRIGEPVSWFLNNYAVSYTYSARFLLNDFILESAIAGKNLIGIAPVNYPSVFSLTDLQGSDRSLKKIVDYFDNTACQVASQASKSNFMRQFSQYRIIQLYTHAADSSINNEPVIYFADSAMYLSELISEKKPFTRLIVLSACQTGTGRLHQGEGVFSFNRGFAALGIPSAIANLWSVDSKATYELTELFYKYLSEGHPTDVALQKAKLEFIKSGGQSLPYYWAAPILTGKAESIELKNSSNWKWALLGVGILAIGGLVWWQRNRPAKKVVMKA